MSVHLGDLYQSPKHGVGQVVDQRRGRFDAPLWVVRYADDTFGSYYTERIHAEFILVGFKALPEGFPKIAARFTTRHLSSSHLSALPVTSIAQPQPSVAPREDNRPYHVVFADFIKRVVVRKEVKK